MNVMLKNDVKWCKNSQVSEITLDQRRNNKANGIEDKHFQGYSNGCLGFPPKG